MTVSRKGSGPNRPVIGWREWVRLPDLGGLWIKAKSDTGARTSSLHASEIEEFDHEGQNWARFVVQPLQKSAKHAETVQGEVVAHRAIRSSSGVSELRPIVKTTLQLGEACFDIELSLSRRDEMGFRMLLGREALRRRVVVDPGRSYLAGLPPAEVVAAHRGR